VHHPDGYVFQQDNASIHTSFETRAFFEEHNVPLLGWPALSPDLNPIENVWGCLARMVYANGRQFSTIGELEGEILRQWKALEHDLFLKLIGSMKSRCIDVLEGKGSCTKY
jgi:transposase